MAETEKPVGVAVLGLGNVGTEVVRIMEDSAEDLAARIGAPLQLRGIGGGGSRPTAACPSSCSPRTSRRWSPATTSTSSSS
ncbi:hypothetical protein [Mycolicibacterium fallax]